MPKYKEFTIDLKMTPEVLFENLMRNVSSLRATAETQAGAEIKNEEKEEE